MEQHVNTTNITAVVFYKIFKARIFHVLYLKNNIKINLQLYLMFKIMTPTICASGGPLSIQSIRVDKLSIKQKYHHRYSNIALKDDRHALKRSTFGFTY